MVRDRSGRNESAVGARSARCSSRRVPSRRRIARARNVRRRGWACVAVGARRPPRAHFVRPAARGRRHRERVETSAIAGSRPRGSALRRVVPRVDDRTGDDVTETSAFPPAYRAFPGPAARPTGSPHRSLSQQCRNRSGRCGGMQRGVSRCAVRARGRRAHRRGLTCCPTRRSFRRPHSGDCDRGRGSCRWSSCWSSWPV